MLPVVVAVVVLLEDDEVLWGVSVLEEVEEPGSVVDPDEDASCSGSSSTAGPHAVVRTVATIHVCVRVIATTTSDAVSHTGLHL